MNLVVAPQKSNKARTPRVLLVDDEPNLIELLGDVFGKDLACKVLVAHSVAEGRRIVENEHVDLMVCDLKLPDGEGTELLPLLRERHPAAGAIVMTGVPSLDRAVTAMRGGAVDFLAKPFDLDDLLDRARAALQRQGRRAKDEARVDRLRGAVRRLNEARKLVTKKVDLLCNDLIGAYGELSRQLDTVRTVENFRNVLNSAKDLEQLLCHAMDWMLRQMGYSNVAIWLAGDGGSQLGAYMKYTIAGEAPLVESMKNGLLPLIARDGLVHLETAEQVQRGLTAEEVRHLGKQTILGVHCTYLGESLASIALFRDATKPFTPEAVATLKAIAPVFAVVLASAVRGNEDADDEDAAPEGDLGHPGPAAGGLADDVGDFDNGDKPPREPGKKPRKKKDDADWWKNGGPPPF